MKHLTALALIAILPSITLHAHTLTTDHRMCSDYSLKGSHIARAVAKQKAWSHAREKARVEAQVVCENRLTGSRPHNLRIEKYCGDTVFERSWHACVKCTATAFFECVKS